MNKIPMNRTPTVFLQAVIVLIGIATLTFLLWEPHVEGRNINATLWQIYFNDPFLTYVYIGSIPFFVALYQAFHLLRHIARNEVFTLKSVKALQTIKYCGMTMIAFIAGAEAYIILVERGEDDIAGGIAMGVFAMFASVIITTAAAVFEKLLESAVMMKQENDSTI